ncbi:hypothetical protein Tco_1356608 [Tanacetum coccineum]
MTSRVSTNERSLYFSSDDKFVWTYTSGIFPVGQENLLQRFKLPEHVLCIGRYFQIELIGQVQKQEIDGKYYICVAHVQVIGRQLSPAFSIAFSEQSDTIKVLLDISILKLMKAYMRSSALRKAALRVPIKDGIKHENNANIEKVCASMSSESANMNELLQ